MDGSNQLVVFTLDNQRYALHLSAVERVVSAAAITPLPKAPDIILGVINVYGRIVPVADIRRRFGLPAREMSLRDQFVIAHTVRRPVILVVDRVEGIVAYSPADVIRADLILSTMRHIDGVLKLKDGMALIHDLDRFLSLEEERSLDEAMGHA